jgi:polar amino acid transport system substrate-binding protein
MLAVVALAGCAAPRDPEGTLERVKGATMRVGATSSHPWTRWEGGRPAGVEVALVERFAASLRAEVEWVEGSEAELVAALEARELDLVVGGLTKESPWEEKAALTRAYVTTRLLVGVPSDREVPPDLEGVRVAVEGADGTAGRVRAAGGVPVTTDDLARADGPVAAEEWELAGLGLRPTPHELEQEEHVMAAPLGENAWLVHLERFLLAHGREVPALLASEARR